MAITYKLVGIDGVEWEFGNPASCPLRLKRTPTGLGGAPFAHDDQQNVDQPGVTWRARMDEPNIIGLEVNVGPVPRGDPAVELLRSWRASLGRGKARQSGGPLGEFIVTSPGGGTRKQLWRLAETMANPDYALMSDTGYTFEEPKLRSDESWWRKEPVIETFTAAEFSGATIPTESDEPVWPYFELTGPITNPTLGIDGEAVPLPTIAAGKTWKIAADPDFFQILDGDGVDRTFIGRRWYKKVPAAEIAGEATDVPITITGTGTSGATQLTVVIPQLFWGAL